MRGLVAALALSLGLASVPAAAEAPAAPSGGKAVLAAASRDGASMVSEIAAGLMFMRTIGVTGVEKASTAALKKLSLEVATASAASFTELRAAAAAAGLSGSVPGVLDAPRSEQAELLLSSFDAQFEHEYIDMQIAAHRSVVALLKDGKARLGASALAAVLSRIEAKAAADLGRFEEAKRQLPAM